MYTSNASSLPYFLDVTLSSHFTEKIKASKGGLLHFPPPNTPTCLHLLPYFLASPCSVCALETDFSRRCAGLCSCSDLLFLLHHHFSSLARSHFKQHTDTLWYFPSLNESLSSPSLPTATTHFSLWGNISKGLPCFSVSTPSYSLLPLIDSSQALPPSVPQTMLTRSRTAVNFLPNLVVSPVFMLCNFTAAGNKIDHYSFPEALFILTFISTFLWSKVFKELQEPTCYRILMPWRPERFQFHLVLLCSYCPTQISGIVPSTLSLDVVLHTAYIPVVHLFFIMRRLGPLLEGHGIAWIEPFLTAWITSLISAVWFLVRASCWSLAESPRTRLPHSNFYL